MSITYACNYIQQAAHGLAHAQEKGMVQISDESEIGKIADQVISEHPKSVEAYKGGKETAIGHLVGQVMRATKGKANPAVVNKILREKLS